MTGLFAELLFVVIVFTKKTECRIPVCRTGINCQLPNCFCLSRSAPGGLTNTKVPQMVVFTFDDAVRKQEFDYYNRLFAMDRLNPNGCPVKITLYLQDKDTDYEMVRTLHQRGMEIACHSITHRNPQSFWREISDTDIRREIYGQKLNIHRKAGVPLSDIQGWRSPFLQPSGNLQFDVLTDKMYGFTYDATLGLEKRDLTLDNMWPFTLDFGYDTHCSIPPCPSEAFPGLWEIPVTSMIDNDNFPRVYVDAYRPPNVTESYRFLMRNFKSYYETNRAPFVLNMHSAWFFFEHNLEAMDQFIKRLLSHDDIYLITVQQLLKWMKAPSALDTIGDFEPWSCADIHPATMTPVPGHMPTTPLTVHGQIAVATTTDSEVRECVQGHTCHIPSCRCSAGINPGNLSTKYVPQIVLFSFEGAVGEHHLKLYNRLFPKWRKNSNGSPVSATLFLSHEGTDYGTVKELYDRGMEVAVHSVTRQPRQYYWRDATSLELESEILGQRSNIIRLAGIPKENIHGWRSPFLQPTGDRQFSILHDNGFEYDSTLILTTTSLHSRKPWPFTLDFGWGKECSILPCPHRNYPGLWTVPVVQSINTVNGLSCNYIHDCLSPNISTDMEFLWTNFNSYYQSNKAPITVNMNSFWLLGNKAYVDMIEEFIERIQKLGDVYIVTIHQALEWMKRPTKLEDMHSFPPWQSVRMTDPASTNDDGPVTDMDDMSTVREVAGVRADTTDWGVVIVVIVAVGFAVFLVLLTGAAVIRKRQNRKRASSLKEAITATSEGNSVTDWLNTFPRRFSQFSCSNGNSEAEGHRNRGFDSPDTVTIQLENGELASRNGICRSKLDEQDELDVDPEILEANYSRDIAIWNQQEIKIPHMLGKSQKRKANGSKNRSSYSIPQENPKSQKHWKYVWHPKESQKHSESVFDPNYETKYIEHIQGIYSKQQQQKRRLDSIEEHSSAERRPRCGRKVTRLGFYSLSRDSSLAYSESDAESGGEPILVSSRRHFRENGPAREEGPCRSRQSTASRSDYGSEHSSSNGRRSRELDQLAYEQNYTANSIGRQYRNKRQSDHNKRYSKSDHGSVSSRGQTESTKSSRSRSHSAGRYDAKGGRRSHWRHRNRSLDSSEFMRCASKRHTREDADGDHMRGRASLQSDRSDQADRNWRGSPFLSDSDEDRYFKVNHVDESKIPEEMKVQWEKEIMEQLGEFLKSKAELRRLQHCRDSGTVEYMTTDLSDGMEENESV